MSRAEISISRTALLTNFKIISAKVPKLRLLPMIKANAYGHDSVFVAQTLLGNPATRKKIYALGVATFREAIEIRLALKKDPMPIVVFSDSAPWTSEHLTLCQRYRLQPVMSEIVSLLEFQRQSLTQAFRKNPVKMHVEVNTGMNRMGIPLESLSLLTIAPESVFTHLADADEPQSKLTQKQIAGYTQAVELMRKRFPKTLFHFANSSAIWAAKKYPLMAKMHLARPGLSLYGIRPSRESKDDGLRRVMTVRAPIINRIYLNFGDQVGYGGTYTCKKKSGEWVAVLGAGYADGVFRSLSSKGIAIYQKKKLRFLGRVSMDLSAVAGDAGMKVGESVVLWGDEVDPYLQAGLAGTIPYELTTRIGERVNRIYE